MVVVPHEDLEWLAVAPKTEIASARALQSPWLAKFYNPEVPSDEFTFLPTINVDLKRMTFEFLWRQISESVDPAFGEPPLDSPDGWCTHKTWDFTGPTVTKSATAIFLSKTLSHDEAFLRDMMLYMEAYNSFDYKWYRVMPRWFASAILVPLICMPVRYYYRRASKRIVPLVRQYLDGTIPEGDTSDTALYHYVSRALKSTDPLNRDPEVIAARLLVMMAGLALPTLYLTLLDVLTNLSRQDAPGYTDAQGVIRREVEALRAAGNGEWQQQHADSLVYTDAFIKESLRHRTTDGFGFGLIREVTDPRGVRIPSLGKESPVLQPGTWLSVATDAIHRDDSIFEAADEFRPWRWVRQESGTEGPVTASKVLDLPASSHDFLAFSRGRVVCPGRFFGADFMRMALAYVVLHYDIKQRDDVRQGDNKLLVRKRTPALDLNGIHKSGLTGSRVAPAWVK